MKGNEYDIIIVGGGLVGMSLACALRGGGVRLALIEAHRPPQVWQPHYDDRTLALAYGSRRIFESMGLWGAIGVHATPIERIHVSDRGRAGIARLAAADAGIEALGYVVELPALGHVLYQALQQSQEIDWFCPATLGTLTFENERAVVQVHDGESCATITAHLVVGADGGRSQVRQTVGIGAHTTDYLQSAVTANVTPGRSHHNIAYERFTSSGPLALLPMREQRCTVVWSVRREHVATALAWDDPQFLEHLQASFGDRLGQFRRVGRRSHHPLALTRVEPHLLARIALVGNAAHTVHPVAGQGFNLGLRDVATLAQLVVDAAGARDDVGDLGLLAQYAQLRRRDTRAVSAFTDGLIRLFANSSTVLGVARSAALIATDLLPPLKRALIRRTSGLAGRLPRLARGLPLGR